MGAPRMKEEERCGHVIKKHDGTFEYCSRRANHSDKLQHVQWPVTRTQGRQYSDHGYRLKRYKLTEAEYYELLDQQDGACAICRKTPEANGKSLAVDHDHSCCPERMKSCGSCIRGLLCDSCNQMLGRARDDSRILLAAVAYLANRT